MNSFIARNKSILVLIALVLCLSTAYGLTVKLDPTVNAATQDTSSTSYSWATMSQAAAQYLGQTTAPDGTHGDGLTVPDPKNGFAGCFLGYMTPNSTDSRFIVAALESSNTVSYSYEALEKLDESFSANGDAWKKSAKVYAGYGYALTEAGLDEPVIIGQTENSKRNLIGPIVLIVFLLSMALPLFFEMVLTFLSVANPFKLFIGSASVLRSIVPTIAAGAGFDNQNGTIASAMGTGVNALADVVTGLYNTLYSLSFMAVIPIMIAIALFSWLVLRQPARNAFKKLAIRMVFIGLGVPLMLACYTAAIDSVKDFMINDGVGAPITVITSTFCDYGSWALGPTAGSNYSNAMALPTNVTMVVDMSNPAQWKYDNNSSTSDRRLVQLINQKANPTLSPSVALQQNMNATSLAQDDKALVTSTAGGATQPKIEAVITLLQRYTKGEYITASSYSAKITNAFNSADTGHVKSYMKLFNLSNNWKDYDPNKAVAFKYEANDGTSLVVDVSEADAKDYAAKRLQTTGTVGTPAGAVFSWHPGGPAFTPGNYTGYASGTLLQSPFPPMAIYNLLSSTFSDTTITVYSTEATNTNQVQLAHYAVSVAGKGYLELAYVFDAVAIMGCLMYLGYAYGFSLLFACFKGLIQMFPKVLTGMIGSMRGIAGALILTAALIIEIIATCIMYALASLFIEHIYDIVEIPIATLLGTGGLNLPSEAQALVTIVASAIIIIKLTQSLVQYRRAVVKSTSEIATSAVNKFLETNVVAPNLEGSMSGKDIAGAALGTAMVLSASPSGSKLADRATEGLSEKLGDLDGEKVASATMTGATRTGDHGEKYSSAEAKQAATSTSGGTYIDNSASESSAPQTEDAKAADYVASNEDDFENEIGYAGTGGSSHSAPAAASDGGEYDEDDKEIRGSKIADNSNDLEDSGPNVTGTVTNGDGTREEYQNGRLVAAYDAKGNKIIDNSTEELTGTKTTDITGTEKGESDKGHTTASGNTIDSSASKFVMTDANGNSQEVQIVNAKTGQAYTQADKDAGANYDVIDAQGNSVYPNVQGGMSANTLAMQNGEPTVMVGPGSNGTSSYGGGSLYQLSAPTPEAVPVTAPVPEAGAAPAPQITQPVTQNTTQNIIQTNNDNTSTSNISNTTQNTSESVMQNVTQGGGSYESGGSGSPVIVGGESAPVVINQGGSGSMPNVNVHVADSGASMPSQTTIQQDYVQNISQAGGNPGYVPQMPSGGGSTVINNNATYNNSAYNTQHMQSTTENVINNTQTSNNSVNVDGGNAGGSERAGLGVGKLSNNPSHRS